MMGAVKDAKKLILYVNFNEASASGLFRRRLDGIRRYAQALGIEVATLGRNDCGIEEVSSSLARLRPAGCIVEPPFLHPRFFRKFPTVFFDVPHMPKWRGVSAGVRCDEAAVAEAAYRELAAGVPPVFAVVSRWMFFHTWPAERIDAFLECCRKDGRECLVLDGKRGESEEAFRTRLGAWVTTLPRRCAIFAVNDCIAVDVAEALSAAHRFMPHDATLVGANAADPSDSAAMQGISSVEIDFELSGYLAAKALAARITTRAERGFKAAADAANYGRAGGANDNNSSLRATPASSLPVSTFGPLLVARRKSTRGGGQRAPFVMEAVDMIRREACDGLTAGEVIERSGVTKSLFTLRFREAMGHSIRAEIEQVRLERVFTLLAETDTPLGVIADMCGFGSEVELRQIFRKRVKTSMKEWRALHR